MDFRRCLMRGKFGCRTEKIMIFWFLSDLWLLVSGLGSMSSIAISYGELGAVFCGLRDDGSHLVSCFGSNSAIIYGTPAQFPFLGLTAGNGFVCGLLMESKQPYCWGSSGFVQMGVPQPMTKGSQYLEISAGDHHLCGLRKPTTPNPSNTSSLVDCWGYNMTKSYVFDGQIHSISAGSEFNCGLLSENQTAFCWGDETDSQVISFIPQHMRFHKIAAGGYHVCGIFESKANFNVFCWGRSLDIEEEEEEKVYSPVTQSGMGSVGSPPTSPMISVVGGKFHACGIKRDDHGVVCWGYRVKASTPVPHGLRASEIAAGDYFTCAILSETSLQPVFWGLGFPSSLPVATSPHVCTPSPCPPAFYELTQLSSPCQSPKSHVCLPCSNGCSVEMYQKLNCTTRSDRQCAFNCSSCISRECFSNCSLPLVSNASTGELHSRRPWSLQLSIIVAEISFIVLLVCSVSLAAVIYVRYNVRNCPCSWKVMESKKIVESDSILQSEFGRIQPDLDELKLRRAHAFAYKELEKATQGFKEESQVGKGSFSCVFKGVLEDGTVIAVKRPIVCSNMKKNSKEFHNELDLLSRLNHAHLLNLLGYCEEGDERLLVYEFMAHGSLHEHLHGKNRALKEQLDWVRRVTIAVQAARGIEYLHSYACPPVIHRDIKSSNILIDEEHNARVSDFGLSLLGPADSSTPLAELPAGTLGYLDPEYYRLHYLTTKSDVYSFGVMLLEILSGRKAIDMQFEEGNIVEWAGPLIKSGEISAILDPVLRPPSDLDSLTKIANVAYKCVRMRGKERPSMDKVTTSLERALALLMGSPCTKQPILPTEVVLGSSRLHKKPSQQSFNWSASENDLAEVEEQQRFEFRAPSWITFPSVTSSQRITSASEADVDGKNSVEAKNLGSWGDGLRLEEGIGPSSQENLFLQHNF